MVRCSECGNPGRLTAAGVCAWRSGCHHRQMQAEARGVAFDAEYAYWFVTLDCGHTPAEHTAAVHDWQAEAFRYFDEQG